MSFAILFLYFLKAIAAPLSKQIEIDSLFSYLIHNGDK